jgi:hypothetical protein
MDTITLTVAENDPDVVVSATLNEEAVTITLVEANDGTNGAGVAAGGVANDILKKTSSIDYATSWETPTSAATANAVVRRDASGGAAFVALTGTGDWSTTGHFLSNPGTATAGHFLTKNGTAPTIIAGRSAWFSDSSGSPQFKNGTSSAITLIYSDGALSTPSSGTLTNCTGLPVTTGISGLGTNVAAFLATPTSANLRSALTDETGTGAAMFGTNPTLTGYTEANVSIGNSGSSKTLSLANGTFQTVTLTGNCTFTMPTVVTGQSFILKVNTGAGGNGAVFTGVKWPGNTAPTITTTGVRYDLVSFIADAADGEWAGSIIQNYTSPPI